MRMTKRLLCLAALPLLQAAAFGEANPYAVIASRNVFQLKPAIETPPPVEAPPPSTKITLLGIVAGFGPKQVMFKTTVGTPPKQMSYILSEGERADELTVLQIDQTRGVVRIDNHGTEQLLSLEKDNLKPGEGAVAGSPSVAPRPALPRPVRFAVPESQAPALSQEEQIIHMEINTKLNAEKVRKGMMPPIPPTPLSGQ
jgi:hypothetical protein